jgi:DNA-binding NarL/FixJ family response regulator
VTIRLLLADDQAVVRAGFRTILESEADFEVIAEAADGDEAVERARKHRPDLVLMDVRMPGTDGIVATRQLAGPGVADPLSVLVITTFDLDDYVFAALRAGACGFLLKDIEPDDLVAAVRTVASGDGLIAPRVTRRLIAEFARGATTQPPEPPQDALTERERETLLLVARGLSNVEIAQELSISASTVKTHIAHLLAKLELRDRVQAVVYAYEHGIVRPTA